MLRSCMQALAELLRMIQFNVRNSIPGIFMNPRLSLRLASEHNYFDES